MFLWLGVCVYCINIHTALIALYQYKKEHPMSARPLPATQALPAQLPPQLPPLSRLLVAAALLWADWESRARSRRALGQLDPHLLRDIGLTTDLATEETRKPFWRD
jgi:uncharacterized protein YjiS (DUF1127 family)